MKLKEMALLCAIVLFITNFNVAVAKDIRAKGDVEFESGLFSSEPDVETKQKAIDNAVINAWKRYTSEFTTAKLNTYRQTQKYFESNLNEFVIDKAVIEQSLDSNTNTFSVVVSVSFNDVAIEAKLNQGNDKNGYVGVKGGKSLFSFLFLAREQDSVKVFDNRRTEMKSFQEQEDKSENTELRGSGGRVKTSREIIDKHVTGGNTLRQADQINYRVYSSSNIDAATSDVLSSNNFEVTPFSDITSLCHGPSMDKIKKEFSVTDELSPELRLEAIRAAKACDSSIRYFAVGTLDARMSDIDPATGNTRTSVSFRGQVYDISSGLARVVASIGPVQKFGLGPDATSATTDALGRAASEGATEIVNQLNSKQLR
ncbi:MAG: hypothetical protein QX194_00680 [Methylococcales bacterium]